MKSRLGLTLALLVSISIPGPGSGVTGQDVPTANPSDVSSIDAIMTAVYDVISGPAGEPRDWDRFRSLFFPGAQLIPAFRSQAGDIGANRSSVEQFIENASRNFAQNPFFEVELSRVTERYGNIAHAFSTYASRRAPEEEPFIRGINSFQLLHDGDRWWVVNIFWADERLSGSIPAKYMSN